MKINGFYYELIVFKAQKFLFKKIFLQLNQIVLGKFIILGNFGKSI